MFKKMIPAALWNGVRLARKPAFLDDGQGSQSSAFGAQVLGATIM